MDDPPPPLGDYVGLVRQLGLYPGSPALIRALLRPDDRLACCELHAEDHAALRRRFAGDPAVAVHRRDAWEALAALLPPQPRRGLVLLDPPYEAPDELDRLAAETRERYIEQRSIAQTLQQALMPGQLPRLPGLSVSARITSR